MIHCKVFESKNIFFAFSKKSTSRNINDVLSKFFVYDFRFNKTNEFDILSLLLPFSLLPQSQ